MRLADLIIAELVPAAGEREVVARNVERRAGLAQHFRIEHRRQARHMVAGRGRGFVALSHHHPAHVFEHRAAVLFGARRAHIDDAGLAVGIFLQPDDFRKRAQRVARIERRAEIASGIAEIGDRIERDVGHGLAEHDVKHQQIVDRRARIADRLREFVRRLHREARAEQAGVERDIAHCHRARRRVTDHFADAKIFKKLSGTRLGH